MAETTQKSSNTTKYIFFAVFGLIAVIFIIYSVMWFYTAGQVKSQVQAAITEANKEDGVTITHGKLSTSGYPFFLRLKVPSPNAKYHDRQYIGENLYAEASPFDPSRIIVFLQGRQEYITDPDRESITEKYVFGGKSVKFSIAQDAFAVDVRDTTITYYNRQDQTQKIIIGKLIGNLDVLDNAETGDENDVLQLKAEGSAIDYIDTEQRKIRLALVAIGFDVTEFKALFDQGMNLGNGTLMAINEEPNPKKWRDAGGNMDIGVVRFIYDDDQDNPPTQFFANGNLNIDAAGYPAGKLQFEVHHPEKVVIAAHQRGSLDDDMFETLDQLLVEGAKRNDGKIGFTYNLKDGGFYQGRTKLTDLQKVVY